MEFIAPHLFVIMILKNFTFGSQIHEPNLTKDKNSFINFYNTKPRSLEVLERNFSEFQIFNTTKKKDYETRVFSFKRVRESLIARFD